MNDLKLRRDRHVAPSRRHFLAALPAFAILSPEAAAQIHPKATNVLESQLFSLPDAVRVYRDELILVHLNVDELDIELLQQFANSVSSLSSAAEDALNKLRHFKRPASPLAINLMANGLAGINSAAHLLATCKATEHAEHGMQLVKHYADITSSSRQTLFPPGHVLSNEESEALNDFVDKTSALVRFIGDNKPDVSAKHISPTSFGKLLSLLNDAELQFAIAIAARDTNKSGDERSLPTPEERKNAHELGVTDLQEAATLIMDSGSVREASFATLLSALSKLAVGMPTTSLPESTSGSTEFVSERAMRFDLSTRVDIVIGVRRMLSLCGYASDWIYVVRITAWVVPLNLVFDEASRHERILEGIARILRPLSNRSNHILLADLLAQGLIWI